MQYDTILIITLDLPSQFHYSSYQFINFLFFSALLKIIALFKKISKTILLFCFLHPLSLAPPFTPTHVVFAAVHAGTQEENTNFL